MERFCKDLREHAMKIINYEEKEMTLLTDKENKFYEKQEVCCRCKKEFSTDGNDKNEFKLSVKSEIIVITQENLEELLIVFAI